MFKKILIILIVLISFLIGSSHAWLRDANIADSSDSVGLGWGLGPTLTGEKIIDNQTSVGMYYMNYTTKTNYYPEPVNFFQISYNKQVIGEKNGTYAFSYYVGIMYSDYWQRHLDTTRTFLIPDIGMAFKWKLSDYSNFRFNMIYYMPAYIEYAWKVQDNMELGISIGIPTQLVSLKWLL